MQHLVDNSCLIYKGNKDFIEGVWDPTFMRGPKQLYVLYQYGGAMHQATFDEEDDVLLPVKDHELTADEFGELCTGREAREKKLQRQKRNRRLALAGTVLAFIAMYWAGIWPFSSSSSSSSSSSESSGKEANASTAGESSSSAAKSKHVSLASLKL